MDEQESELLKQLATDPHRYFLQLVQMYQHTLYTFLLRLTVNACEAEDILQDAFMGAYISLTCYSPERIRTLNVHSWLYKVTLNVFRNSKRGGHSLLLSLELEQEEHISDALDVNPDQMYEITEQLQELDVLLIALPESYRTVIICYYFEELSYQEIADLLDQPLGTIKSRLHRGIQLLRSRHNTLLEERKRTHGAH